MGVYAKMVQSVHTRVELVIVIRNDEESDDGREKDNGIEKDREREVGGIKFA